jgi:hypothetical protein
MFTIRGALSPVLYVLTGIIDRDGKTFVQGSACGGIFTCEIDLNDMVDYGMES